MTRTREPVSGVSPQGKPCPKLTDRTPSRFSTSNNRVRQAAHRLGGGGIESDHPAIEQRGHRLDLAFRRAMAQIVEFPRTLGKIDMGILLHRDDDGCVPQHRVRQVAMQIKHGADGGVGAGDRPDAADEIAFAIVAFGGDHRPVQEQENDVERSLAFEIGQNLVAIGLIDRMDRRARGLRESENALDNFVPDRARPIRATVGRSAQSRHRCRTFPALPRKKA
jgi:hypothetical protein